MGKFGTTKTRHRVETDADGEKFCSVKFFVRTLWNILNKCL